MQTHEFSGRRWSIISQKPFDAVVAEVEAKIGRPNFAEFVARMTAATSYEEMEIVVHDSVSEIGLMEFMRLDHGAVLAKAGVDGKRRIRPSNTFQPRTLISHNWNERITLPIALIKAIATTTASPLEAGSR